MLTLAIAASLAGGGTAPVAAAGASTEVRIGQAQDLTRIEFRGAQPLSVGRDGREVVLRFGPITPPDLTGLRVTPPRFVKGASAKATANGLEVRLALTEDASAKLGRADGSAFIVLTAAANSDSAAPPAAPPSGPPRAVSGPVVLKAAMDGRALKLSFDFGAPVGAAVFRRGEAVWAVFDAHGELDLKDAPSGLPQLKAVQRVDGAGVLALRLIAPTGVQAVATQADGTWTITLANGPSPPETGLALDRGPDGELTASVSEGAQVRWLHDPAVGDRLAVMTAPEPLRAAPRRFVEGEVLASAQGVAVQPVADNLSVSASGGRLVIGRPHGLALSHALAAHRDAPAGPALAQADSAHLEPELASPRAAQAPGLIPFAAWSAVGRHGFLARYDTLTAAASEEAAQGAGAAVEARLALARFLIGSELAYEGIGVLNLLGRTDAKLMDGAEFRGLRGAARAMAGRAKEAESDLTTAAVALDPASALWLAYARAGEHDWTGAKAAFAAGRAAKAAFDSRWRARFAAAEARTALALSDVEGARAALAEAPGSGVDPLDLQALTLARAQVAEMSGKPGEALSLYESVRASSYGAVSAPAALHALQLKLAARAIPSQQALAELDSLRFRWRGDGTELDVVRALSSLYLGQGRYREALEAMRSAGKRLPDLPEAVQLQADLAAGFRALFLDGLADALQPIQALALFDDYRELTPIGADGDMMVRRLAKRLVAVDLLDQAAGLLKYQVENRLDGVPKAEVSSDLAAIYLMARRPEDALNVIAASRTTLLPAALNGERRVLEARALVGLGRFDHALEVLGADRSAEALEIRGDADWARRSWADAGAALEASLGERWRGADPLSPEEEQKLLRAGIAYSLSQDAKALARLRARWGRLAGAGRAPDAMRIALTAPGDAPLSSADIARAASETDAFATWIARAKARFLAKDGRGAAPHPPLPAGKV